MQGWRVEMEDAHIAMDIPSKPNHLFLGVWDGHAGDGAAKYAADNLVNVLQSTREWKLYLENGEENVDLLSQALIEAFLKIDISIKAFQESTLGEDTSGCTSVTAIVTPKFIICANAGDSRCVMGSNGECIQLSDDHKPTLLIERTRIENAGGIVQWGRVDGDLAVSRALGDFGYKDRPDLPQDAQKVSCYPDIKIHERTNKDDVLLLACDGLWDVMSTSEAVTVVRELYESGETSVERMAEELLDLSLLKGSKDNISALLVKLPGAVIGPPTNGGIFSWRRKKITSLQHRKRSPSPSTNLSAVWMMMLVALDC